MADVVDTRVMSEGVRALDLVDSRAMVEEGALPVSTVMKEDHVTDSCGIDYLNSKIAKVSNSHSNILNRKNVDILTPPLWFCKL